MSFKRVILCFALLLCAGGLRAAQADPLVLTVTNVNQFVEPGGTAVFFVLAVNNGFTSSNADVITRDIVLDVTVSDPRAPISVLDISIAPFRANFNGQTIAVGSPLGPLPAITVTIPANAPRGAFYSGDFQFIYRGRPDSDLFITNVAPWTVRVGAETPEPATVLLLGTGLAGLVCAARRRRRA